MKEYRETIEHNGHTIGVTGDYRFAVEGHGWHDSLSKAKDEIDNLVAAAAKQEKRKIAIPGLDENGNKIVIKGLHAARGEILPQSDEHYPLNAKLQELLVERKHLSDRVAEIRKMVLPFCIRRPQYYGRIQAEHYEDALEKLEKEIADKSRAVAKVFP